MKAQIRSIRLNVERFRVQLPLPLCINVSVPLSISNAPEWAGFRPTNLLFPPTCSSLHFIAARGLATSGTLPNSPQQRESCAASGDQSHPLETDEPYKCIGDDNVLSDIRVASDKDEEGEETDIEDDAELEDICAGDLSDCPPALKEFVFTNPHPFPFTADPEDLEPQQVKDVVKTLLSMRNCSTAAAVAGAAPAAPEGTAAAASEAATPTGAATPAKPTAEGREGVYSEPSRWCSEPDMALNEEGETKWLQYPEPNVLWPNPLLHNHRLQPFTCTVPAEGKGGAAAEGTAESAAAAPAAVGGGPSRLNELQLRVNRLRLEELWKYSGVYGTSWDELDEVYVQFRQQQQQRQQQWDTRKQQILEYAGVVCARRLRAKRQEYLKEVGVKIEDLQPDTVEQILVPRSLFRRMTRRLYYKWHDTYFAPWRPGGLQSVLKAHVTLRMLLRETNERQLHLKDDAAAASLRPSGAAAGRHTANRTARDNTTAAATTTNQQAQLQQQLERILRRRYSRQPIGSKMPDQQREVPKGDASKGRDREAHGAFLHADESMHATAEPLHATPAVESSAEVAKKEEGVWDFTGVRRRNKPTNRQVEAGNPE